MSQKQMTNYLPRGRKAKKKLDTWTVEEAGWGYRSVWTPDYEEHPVSSEDCTEVVIRNTRTGDEVTVKDDLGMMEFWKEIQGFSFKWKGGKRIQKRTIEKALEENGYEIRRAPNRI